MLSLRIFHRWSDAPQSQVATMLKASQALKSIFEQTHRKPMQGRGTRVYVPVRKETHLRPR